MESTAIENKQVKQRKLISSILALQEKVKALPNAMIDDCFPLKHSWGEGCYVREIVLPAKSLTVTKIHAVSHPLFILSGSCRIGDDKATKDVIAPFYTITKAGTKRVIFAYEETVMVTVHVTNKTNLSDIENAIILKEKVS